MKKLTLFVLVVALIASLAIPAMADEENLTCGWGTPTVDGEKDACYTKVATVNTESPKLFGTDDYDGGVSADFYMCNDGENFYVFAEVQDSTPIDVIEDSWMKDSAEFWFRSSVTHVKIAFDAFCGDHGHVSGTSAEYWGPYDIESDVVCASKRVDGGYVVEGSFPIDIDAIVEDGEVEVNFQVNDFTDPNAAGSNTGSCICLGGQLQKSEQTGSWLTLAEEPEETAAPETQAPAEETQAPAEETQAPAEETQAPAEETEAPSDDPSPVTADIAVIAAGVALAAAAVVIFKKH